MVVRYTLLLGVLALGFLLLAALLPSLPYAGLALSGAVISVALIVRKRRPTNRMTRHREVPPQPQVRWISPASLWHPLIETEQDCGPSARPIPLGGSVGEIVEVVRAMAALDIVVELSDDGRGDAEWFMHLWDCLASAVSPPNLATAGAATVTHLAHELVSTDASAEVIARDDGSGEAFMALFERLQRLAGAPSTPSEPAHATP